MKKFLIVLLLSSFVMVHCGGEGGKVVVGSEAQAQETAELVKFKNEAIPGAGGNVAVDAGFAANGTKISLPAGFTTAQCKMTAALANIQGNALSTSVAINTTTGEVICKKVVQEREEVPPETKDCVASYTIICVK